MRAKFTGSIMQSIEKQKMKVYIRWRTVVVKKNTNMSDIKRVHTK